MISVTRIENFSVWHSSTETDIFILPSLIFVSNPFELIEFLGNSPCLAPIPRLNASEMLFPQQLPYPAAQLFVLWSFC